MQQWVCCSKGLLQQRGVAAARGNGVAAAEVLQQEGCCNKGVAATQGLLQ